MILTYLDFLQSKAYQIWMGFGIEAELLGEIKARHAYEARTLAVLPVSIGGLGCVGISPFSLRVVEQ